jgi:hypothetical protein
MRREVLDDLEATILRLKAWEGREVAVEESLSRHASSHNRHFATRSVFRMRLESVGARFSGTALMFLGSQAEQPAQHEVALDCIEQLEFIGEGQVVIVERFASRLERRSTITAPSEAGPLGGDGNE